MQRFSSLVVVVALAATATAQLSIVVPNGMAAAEGNTSSEFPWGRGGTGLLHQAVYDSSHFTAQGITYPIVIHELRWRPNTNVELVATSFPTPCSVRLSTSPVDWSAVSPLLASQRGADERLCFQGPVSFPAQAAQTGPTPFGINIPLAPPFVYDPSVGDLTIECDLPVQFDYVGGQPQLDVQDAIGQANASLVHWSTGYTGYPGTVATGGAINYGVVVRIDYVPAAGLQPLFTGTPRSGPLGQLVSFADHTYTTDPGGVTSWAWDVDGVPGIDYTTQHCSHTYTTEGVKNVTLTVTSALFGTQSLTKTGYIRVDAVGASFTASIAPGTTIASFTDRSAGNPTSWAWDFENDGIVDSAAQNPVHTYPPGTTQFPCRLTVTDAFSSDTTTVNIGFGIVPVPAAGAMFMALDATPGFWFRSPTRFSIISAKVPDLIDSTQHVAIFRLAAAPPILPAVASGGLEFFSLNQPVASPIPCIVSYDVGEYVGVLGAGAPFMSSSLATTAGPFSSSVVGVPTTLTRFGTPFNISAQGPDHPYSQEPSAPVSRVILEVTACAAIPYGAGSPSGLGPPAPKMRAVALPFLGQSAVHTVEQHDAFVFQFMAGGFGRASFTLPPLGTILIGSLDLLEIMPGAFPAGPGITSWSFPVPNLPSLVGATINFQNVNLVLQSGTWSMSNGIEWVIGV
jgi:PKD repeat protein